MTPRVLGREFEAARLRAIDRYRELTMQAWQTIRFYGAFRSNKGMQPLTTYLDEVGSAEKKGLPPAQGPVAAQAALEIIAAQWGLRMRKVKT